MTTKQIEAAIPAGVPVLCLGNKVILGVHLVGHLRLLHAEDVRLLPRQIADAHPRTLHHLHLDSGNERALDPVPSLLITANVLPHVERLNQAEG